MSIEAMKQALALICSARLCEFNSMSSRREMLRLMIEATDALRAALAEPEQEPVAYYHPHKGFYWAKPTRISAPTAVDVKPLPLYTTPPQRKPLTDEEIEVLAKKHNGIYYDCDITFARAIEAAHGIKGGA